MKKSFGKKAVLYQHPALVIGSYGIDGRPNIMTASWGGICASQPPCVTVSIRKSRHSYEGIMKNRAYSVNIPSVKYIEETDIAGTWSGKDHDKFEELGLTPLKCPDVNAPYVKEFPVVLSCSLVNTVEAGSHTMFIGEITDFLADSELSGENGMPEIEKVDTFIYDTASHHYYSIGERLIRGYSAAKSK